MSPISSDLLFLCYIGWMILSFVLSFFFGSKMVKKTGLFAAQTMLAVGVYFLLGFCAILSWGILTWGVDVILFLGGLAAGTGMLVIGEAILVILLLIRRKKMLRMYHNKNTNTEVSATR